MTPAEQRALYETASTVQDVVTLLQARGLPNEAGYVEALHAMILAHPIQALNTIRGLAEEHDRTIADILRRAEKASSAWHRQELERRAEVRKRQAAGLRWAATALTRGMAFGTMRPSVEQSTEEPCACGAERLHYPGATGCLGPDLSDGDSVFVSYQQRHPR